MTVPLKICGRTPQSLVFIDKKTAIFGNAGREGLVSANLTYMTTDWNNNGDGLDGGGLPTVDSFPPAGACYSADDTTRGATFDAFPGVSEIVYFFGAKGVDAAGAFTLNQRSSAHPDNNQGDFQISGNGDIRVLRGSGEEYRAAGAVLAMGSWNWIGIRYRCNNVDGEWDIRRDSRDNQVLTYGPSETSYVYEVHGAPLVPIDNAVMSSYKWRIGDIHIAGRCVFFVDGPGTGPTLRNTVTDQKSSATVRPTRYDLDPDDPTTGILWVENIVDVVFSADRDSDDFIAGGSTFANDDAVRLVKQTGTALPGGFTAGTTYYVINVSGDTFQLAATIAGPAVDVTSTGGGVICMQVGHVIDDGDGWTATAANDIGNDDWWRDQMFIDVVYPTTDIGTDWVSSEGGPGTFADVNKVTGARYSAASTPGDTQEMGSGTPTTGFASIQDVAISAYMTQNTSSLPSASLGVTFGAETLASPDITVNNTPTVVFFAFGDTNPSTGVQYVEGDIPGSGVQVQAKGPA
jgi:hypothetical protein